LVHDAIERPWSHTILLVAEDPPAARAIRERLADERRGRFEVHLVPSLEHAADALRRRAYDVLIALAPPREPGMDTLLRAGLLADRLPIVMITAEPDEELGLRAMEAGIQECLVTDGRVPADLGRTLRHAAIRHHIAAEQRRTKELLEHEALHDRLTELPHRAAFLARLGEQTQSRDGAHFAVLAIDLDRFKVINDSLGQAAGDQLLASVARRISACLGKDDTAARLGSDEFAVLLRGTASLTDSLRLAESLCEALAMPLEIGRQEIFPSASIGIVPGESYEEAEPLLRDAHIALARAKSLGGRRCEIFDRAMGGRRLDRLRLENELRRAIEHQELEMHYQPIVRLSHGTTVAFEALLRWRCGERGMIPPAEFIPIAEESGLILPLSYWTLDQVCARLREWEETGVALHLNVSVRLFSDPSFVDRVWTALADCGAGDRLVLEVTESTLMENLDFAVETLVCLKALGVGISIDDFGTGYSSLSYLQRFPVDSLKIDGSFVSKLGKRSETPEIVRAIVSLARSLDVDVIAECVETEEQLVHLLSLGCGLAQGYLFSRAVDRETARGLLAAEPPEWTRLLPGSKIRPFPVLEDHPGRQLRSRAAS
jgi:diguanylate cyclase (GGDEF)-like protein